MRALVLPAVALALACAVVLVGGRMVESPAGMEPVAVERIDAEAIAAAEGTVASTTVTSAPAATPPAPPAASPPSDATAALAAPAQSADALATLQAVPEQAPSAAELLQPKPLTPSRLVAPAIVAPPELAAGEELLREAPRKPLSQLGLALPPPPPPEFKNPWAGKPLFRPVAVESAVFESGGHTIAIDGVESIAAEESCVYDGASWPCGVRARAAFRLWLRGRALVCQIPEDRQDEKVVRASCRLAKQDAGAWLVANGWARAAPDGPYVQAEEKARSARMGIFGPPPDTSAIPEVPDAPLGTMVESQPIMTEEGVDPQPVLGPQLAFPPAPPPP